MSAFMGEKKFFSQESSTSSSLYIGGVENNEAMGIFENELTVTP
jgi:hypothetical protein